MGYNRDNYLKKTYGISLKQYNVILKRQKNRCAICGKHRKDSKMEFDVDHSHKSPYEVRGLLCRYCNSYLMKYLRDDIVRAKGLVEYLKQWIKEISK